MITISYLEEYNDDQINEIIQDIRKFNKLSEEYGMNFVNQIFENNIYTNLEGDSSIESIIRSFEIYFTGTFITFLFNSILKYSKELDISLKEFMLNLKGNSNWGEKSDEEISQFTKYLKILSLTFSRKFRSLSLDMSENTWKRISTSTIINKNKEISFKHRISLNSGSILNFSLTPVEVLEFLNEMINIFQFILELYPDDILIGQNDDFSIIESVYIDIFRIFVEKQENPTTSENNQNKKKVNFDLLLSPKKQIRIIANSTQNLDLGELEIPLRNFFTFYRHMLGLLISAYAEFEKYICYLKLTDIRDNARKFYEIKAEISLINKKAGIENYEKLKKNFEKLVEKKSEDYYSISQLAANSGDLDFGLQKIEDYLVQNPNDLLGNKLLAILHSKRKNFQKSIEIEQTNYEQIKDSNDFRNISNSLYNTACFYSLSENKEKAIGYLAKAIAINYKFQIFAKYEEDFENIKNSDEFKALIE